MFSVVIRNYLLYAILGWLVCCLYSSPCLLLLVDCLTVRPEQWVCVIQQRYCNNNNDTNSSLQNNSTATPGVTYQHICRRINANE